MSGRLATWTDYLPAREVHSPWSSTSKRETSSARTESAMVQGASMGALQLVADLFQGFRDIRIFDIEEGQVLICLDPWAPAT